MSIGTLYLRVATLTLAATLLAGCVTPITLEQETPDLSYKATRPMLVVVLDEREVLAQGKPPTFIGRAHGAFGIPADMQVYPWLLSDKEKKGQPLSKAIEDRIVLGLNDEGWQLAAVDIHRSPPADETAALLVSKSAQRLIVLSISQWYVSINLSWVTAFNFDWGYTLDVLDEHGSNILSVRNSGRDVVDAKADQSYQNLLKLAFRERLIRIFEDPTVRGALQD